MSIWKNKLTRKSLTVPFHYFLGSSSHFDFVKGLFSLDFRCKPSWGKLKRSWKSKANKRPGWRAAAWRWSAHSASQARDYRSAPSLPFSVLKLFLTRRPQSCQDLKTPPWHLAGNTVLDTWRVEVSENIWGIYIRESEDCGAATCAKSRAAGTTEI